MIALLAAGMAANAQCKIAFGGDTLDFDCERWAKFDTNQLNTSSMRLSKLVICNPTKDDLIGYYNGQGFRLKAGRVQVFVGDELTQIPDCEIYTRSGQKLIVFIEKVLIPKSRFYGSFGANRVRQDNLLQGRY